MSQPVSTGGGRRKRLPILRASRLRRAHPLAAAALLVLGLAIALPSCRAASRWNLFRMTPTASDLDSTSMDTEPIMNDPNIVWNCPVEGLDEGLLAALRRVAAEYRADTGQTIIVNSGARTLRRQAELMSDMSRSQLEGMYCQQGYPGYVNRIVSARQTNRGVLDAEKTYAILRDRDDGYISTHLFGAAVDISPSGADVSRLRDLLEKHGFTAFDERSLGVNCLHATYRAVPRRIVRE